jgi:hypothetical protein
VYYSKINRILYGAYGGASWAGRPKKDLRVYVHVSERKGYLHTIHIFSESLAFAGYKGTSMSSVFVEAQ